MTKAEQVEAEAREQMRAEVSEIRALLEATGAAIGARLVHMRGLVSDAVSSWRAAPPDARAEVPPFLFDPLASAAGSSATGIAAVRALLAIIETEDRAAGQADWATRQREADARQEQERRARQPELDRVMRVEKRIGTFNPRSRMYDGQ